MKYQKKCIICKIELETNREKQITCGAFECRQIRAGQRARYNMELKKKNEDNKKIRE